MNDLMEIRVGAEVGARRWPFSTEYPGNWGTPWKGQVLDQKDPRAWVGTGAFPVANPDPAEVAAHVDRLGAVCGLERVPVLWNFGGLSVVYWERASGLRPYATDYTEWLQAREREFDRLDLKEKAHA